MTGLWWKRYRMVCVLGVGGVATALSLSPRASAHNGLFGQGGLLATGGVTSISGAAGGGVNPWALIAGYGTNDQIGGTLFYTHLGTQNYSLNAYGVSVGIRNRVELSVARQNFGLGSTGAALDGAVAGFVGVPVTSLPAALQFGSNYSFRQTIYGAKVRVFGNAVYDQNTLLPQVSVGLNYHQNDNTATIEALGARANGTTYYIAATKLFLDGLFGRYTLINVGLRLTNSNDNGLLGFGGISRNGGYDRSYQVEPNVSFAQFITRDIAVGYDFRAMPHYQLVGYNGLGNAISKTNPWQDVFVAVFPTKNISITAAYARLGTVASVPNQNGLYVSLTASF